MFIPRLILVEFVQGLGKPGGTGLFLLIASLVYGMAVIQPALEEKDELQQQAARTAAALARLSANDPIPTAVEGGNEQSVFSSLPAQSDVSLWVEHIYDLAATEQLSLARGEYVLASVSDTRLVRYQIFLPMKGDYLQIRRFIASAEDTVPGLALEGLSLQRQQIGDRQVEALIRFSLYLAKQ